MGLIKGLNIVEEILMILGILLCVIIICLIIYKSIKNKSIKEYLPFLVISVIMMGWATIKKISYDGTTGSIEKSADSLLLNPGNTRMQLSIQKNIAKIQNRASGDENALYIIAKANLALGDTVKSRENIQKALKIKPESKRSNTLKLRVR